MISNDNIMAELTIEGLGLTAQTANCSLIRVKRRRNGVAVIFCTHIGGTGVAGKITKLKRSRWGKWSCTTTATIELAEKRCRNVA